MGPYFDADSPYDYALAPGEELEDPSMMVLLGGKVGLITLTVSPGRDDDDLPQILDSSCQGVAGALVEVWYAGKDALGGDGTAGWIGLDQHAIHEQREQGQGNQCQTL